MLTTHQDQEGHWTQIPLTRFQTNSREAYQRLLDSNRLTGQKERIINRLSNGSAQAQDFGLIKQYNARIYELRRSGFCITNTKEVFSLIQAPHDFDNNNKCINCGTPRGKE